MILRRVLRILKVLPQPQVTDDRPDTWDKCRFSWNLTRSNRSDSFSDPVHFLVEQLRDGLLDLVVSELLFGSSIVNRLTSLPSGPKTNTAGMASMSSFSKPSPKFSSRSTLVKTAFFSLRNFSASATAALSVGSSSESEMTASPLRGELVHRHDVREILLAGAARRRPGVDDRDLVSLVGRRPILKLLPVQPSSFTSPRRSLSSETARCRRRSDSSEPGPSRAAAIPLRDFHGYCTFKKVVRYETPFLSMLWKENLACRV